VIYTLTDETEAMRLWAFLRDRWRKAAEAGKPLLVEVGQVTQPQTRRQQRRYRAILREIAEKCWLQGQRWPMERWHEHFASEYIGTTTDEFGVIEPISTTELNRGEFNDYVEQIISYVTTVLGVEIETL
jgi:hypothetical protein